MGIIVGVMIFFLFLFGISFLVYSYYDVGFDLKEKSIEIKLKDKVYQGPVPEGYDEDHFRKTGETIPLE